MKANGSLLCSLQPATGIYSEPDESSPHHTIHTYFYVPSNDHKTHTEQLVSRNLFTFPSAFFSFDSRIITVTTQNGLPGWRSSATWGTSMILWLVTHKAVARAVQTATHIAFEVLRHVEVCVSHVTLEGPGTCEALATQRAVRRTTYSTATANPAPS